MPTPIQETVVTVEGNAYAGFWVEVYRNNALVGTVLTDHQGRFKLDGVDLVSGQNILMARQLSKRVDLGDRFLTLDPSDSKATIVEVITGTPTRPNVTIEFPMDGAETDASFLPLRGAVSGSIGRLRLNAYYYEGNGYALPQGGKFVSSHKVPLLPGKNTLWVEATAPDGSRGVDKITVYSRRDAVVPTVQITAPVVGEEIFTSTISPFGTVDASVQTVIVNETEALLGSGTFQANFIDILSSAYVSNPEGHQRLITAWAMDANGQIGHYDVPVRYRFIPTPFINITLPIDGAIVTISSVTVMGQVRDASEVTVNGIPAEIDVNGFSAEIDLQEGTNIINVIAQNTIKASADSISVLYQPPGPIVLQTIAIDPADSTVPLGGSVQLNAIGTTSDGNSVDLSIQVAWTSNSPQVASADYGFVLSKGLGITTVTATLGGVSGSTTVSVLPPALESIRILYPSATGSLITTNPTVNVGDSLSLQAFGTYSDNSVVDITSLVTWIGDDPTVATIDSSGMVMGISNGIVQISASYQSITGNNTLTVLPPALYLFINSPIHGSTINRENVMVTGTIISQAQEVGITVNGVIANIFGNQFTANGVFLVDGSNTITAQAIDSNGAQAQAQITLDAITTDPYITLTSNIASGIAPLDLNLRITGTFTIATSALTYIGPGTPVITKFNEVEYHVHIDTEGIYFFTANATDDQGVAYTDTTGIVVLNPSQMDSLLQGKWTSMINALNNGDAPAALEEIVDEPQPSYQTMFSVLGNQLSSILNSFVDLSPVSIEGQVAIYELVTDEGGIIYSYELVFVKDQEGIWRILEF